MARLRTPPALALPLALLLAIASCARHGGAVAAGVSGGMPAWEPVEPLAFDAPPGTALRRVLDAGVLRWGCDPAGGAPFALPAPWDPRELVGFEIELVARLCDHLGVRSEPVAGDWLALIDNLRAGRTDLVLNGLEVTPERAEVVDFTVPYYRYGQQLTVRDADRGRFASLADLRGHRISVLNGSASVDVLTGAGWAEEDIAQYEDSLTPYAELKNGRVDGSLAESIIAGYYAPGVGGLHNVPGTFSPGVYAGAVRKGDAALRDAIDAALRRMMERGELGRIYQRWGVWTDAQRELGTVRGPDVARIDLAAVDAATGLDWGAVLAELARATAVTVLLTAISMPLAVLLGLVLALMDRSRRRVLSWPARAYVQVVRGTPILVQIFLVYYSLPMLGQVLGLGDALVWPALVVGIVCLAGNYAAYEAEIHRAGLEAVPKGQREAAWSLGLSQRQTLWLVELPQSFRIILPPLVNDLVAMIKDTSLVYVIGVRELTSVALGIGKSRLIVPEMLVVAAGFYLVVSLAADAFGRRIAARLRRAGLPRPALAAHATHRSAP
ncbi:MAG: ABC transporter permease subunit [Planctomycetes bacterium]|nr:ABC transporter permease subunit [Planctomycetota bacterium]